jgi:hypothetical protein
MLRTNQQKAEAWQAQQAAVNKFIQFRKETTAKKESSASFWDELDGMCLKAIKKSAASGVREYDFSNHSLREQVFGDLQKKYDKALPFELADFDQIDNFLLGEQEHGDKISLDDIKKKIDGLIPRGRLDSEKLEGSIWLKRTSINRVLLARLQFRPVQNPLAPDKQ